MTCRNRSNDCYKLQVAIPLQVTMPLFLHLADWWPERNWHILHSRSKGHMAKQTHSSSNKQVLLQWITTCFYHVSIIVKRDLWWSLTLAGWTQKNILGANTCNERCCAYRLGSLQRISRSLCCFVSIEFEFHLFPSNSIQFHPIPSM
jgi:hypothetical protein